MKNAFLSLDIGTNNIYAVLFKCEQKPQVLFSVKKPSSGVRKGAIQNVNEVVNNISDLLDEIEQATATNISQLTIGIGGIGINMNNSRGIALISGRNNSVDKETILRAQNSSKALFLPPGRTTLHAIPQKYIIDGNEFDVEPLNMTGIRLEVESAIIDTDLMVMNHISQIGESVGIKVTNIFAGPLSGTFSTLSKREKDLGAIGIDLGASTTTITVFEEGKLIFMKVLPIGCGKISDDICLWLQIPQDDGEKIKISVGDAYPDKVEAKEIINLNEICSNEDKRFKKKDLSIVISSRLEQIFDLVNKELKQINKFANLPGGAVLYGGGAMTKHIVELAKDCLKLPVRIAQPEFGGFINDDPGFAVALGNIKFLFEDKNDMESCNDNKSNGLIGKILKIFEIKF